MERFLLSFILTKLVIILPTATSEAYSTHDVCGTNVTLTDEGVYLNYTQNNKQHVNKTCSCALATSCRDDLVFQVLDFELSSDETGKCLQTMVLEDGDPGKTLASLNCSYNILSSVNNGTGSVFRSGSNKASLDLHIMGNNTGRFLIRVTASGGSPVEVLCGQPEGKVLLNRTLCTSGTTPASGTEGLSSASFNTTKEACLLGMGSTLTQYDFEIDCFNAGTVGLISVEHLYHGVTPTSLGCGPVSAKDVCCPGYNSDRDCLFSTKEGLKDLKQKCNGLLACSPQLQRARVDGSCPPKPTTSGQVTYAGYSYFAFVQYTCVSTQLMTDICTTGDVLRNKEVYMESNVYHNNRQLSARMCNCVLSTECGQQLLFRPVDLRLATNDNGTCVEQISILDFGEFGNNSLLTSDCLQLSNTTNSELDDVNQTVGELVFKSKTNVVEFQLRLLSNHTGRVLFKVTATNEAMVEARCGRATELSVWEGHQCNTSSAPTVTPPPVLTTITSVATSAPVTNSTAGTDGEQMANTEGDSTDFKIPVLAAIAALCLCLILFFFICVVVLFVRKHRARQDQDQRQTNYLWMPEMSEPYQEPVDSFNRDVSANVPGVLVNGTKESEAGMQNLGPEVQGAVGFTNEAYYVDWSDDEYTKHQLPEPLEEEKRLDDVD